MRRSWLVGGYGLDMRQRCAVRVSASAEAEAVRRARRRMRRQGLWLGSWEARELDVLARGVVQ